MFINIENISNNCIGTGKTNPSITDNVPRKMQTGNIIFIQENASIS